jgi:hypothetical protein
MAQLTCIRFQTSGNAEVGMAAISVFRDYERARPIDDSQEAPSPIRVFAHAFTRTFLAGPVQVWFEDSANGGRSDHDNDDVAFELSGGVRGSGPWAELRKPFMRKQPASATPARFRERQNREESLVSVLPLPCTEGSRKVTEASGRLWKATEGKAF